YARLLLASGAKAGRHWRPVGAKTHCRAAPQHLLGPEREPSTGPRSRDSTCPCAPLRDRDVLSNKRRAKTRGENAAILVKVSAPAEASGIGSLRSRRGRQEPMRSQATGW